VKFAHRNVFKSGVTFDVDGTYAVFNNQQQHTITLGQPHLFDDRFLALLRIKYRYDPQREFFGLGNNNRGPEPASTHAYEDMFAVLTFGWRPMRRLALNLSAQFRYADIRRGDGIDDCGPEDPCPFTDDAFPLMPGVRGGKTNPLSVSLVWNGRDEVIRPTRGWLAILKVSHTNEVLLSDFQFTRIVGDVGYLYPFFGDRVVAGLHANAAWMDGPSRQIPFWELAGLGGSDTLRGFFPYRFAGKARVLLQGELRALLTEFDFRDWWHVKLDGVVFGEAGRVLLDPDDIADESHATRPDIEYSGNFPLHDLNYSYGGGLRIALSSALVARLDAGFSEEETALVYLTFGQTF
jgi:outer membrane protein assembly factor BamA